jgi:hypothetical protein
MIWKKNISKFRSSPEMNLQLSEPIRISYIFEETSKLIQEGQDALDREVDIVSGRNIGPLIDTLQKMKEIWLDESGQVSRHKTEYVRREVPICYTETEEMWLQFQFGQLQSNYVKVQPPEFYIEEMINLFKFNTAVSDNFVGTW